MELWISGGAWITAKDYGTLSEDKELEICPGEPVIPEAKELFHKPLARYGRFDTFTKLGCAGAALAFRDASDEKGDDDVTTGMIISSDYEVLSTDIDYYETTIDQDGALSSPNMFSYTLPVIALGECAVHFHLTGPTFCVGDDALYGLNALGRAAAMIVSGKADRMIAGWIESPPEFHEEKLSGAMFVILDKRQYKTLPRERKLIYENHLLLNHSGQEIKSLKNIFKSGEN